MNFSKAEMKVALQARLDAETTASAYTVGDGEDCVAALADLTAEENTKAIYYGQIFAVSNSNTNPGTIKAASLALMAEYPAHPKTYSVKKNMRVDDGVVLKECVFGYAELNNTEGMFIGYKFPLTTIYELQEDGSLMLDEDGNPIEEGV